MEAPDIVQFSCQIYFTKEGDDHFSVDVMRLGSLEGRVAVRLRSQDGSAKADEHYYAVDQEIVLENGESLVSVEIPIAAIERWAPTLEFKLVLDEPRNCITGAYLYTCRVKLYTDDTFPSNKYKDEIEQGEGGVDELSGFMLFHEFFKWNFGLPGIGWRTVMTLIFDQLPNVYMYVMLTAKAYLVNMVLSDKTESDELIIPDRHLCATAIGMLYVVPLLLLQYWKYSKLKIDIQGKTKAQLQCCVFRKYLNYDEASMENASAARMQGALTSKCGDVACAYVDVLDICQSLGSLVVLIAFTLINDPGAWWVLIVMPTLMLIFGCCRSNALSKAGEKAGPLKRNFLGLINETCEKYTLIAEYNQRPQMNDMFETRVEQVREAVIPEAQVETNNKFFPKLLGPLFIGIYISLYAPLVIRQDMKLGDFLAMVSVFGDVAGDFSGIYDSLMSINTRLDSVVDITKLLNKATDVPIWRRLNRKRRETTNDYRTQVMTQPPPDPDLGMLRTDMIPIVLTGVRTGYEPGLTDLLSGINVEVPQGKVVAVVGPPGEGTTTFMKLLGHRVIPLDGSVFIPTHLRILFVAQTPMLMNLSPWQNLTFGHPHLSEDDAEDRTLVRKILEEVDLGNLSQMIDDEKDSHKYYSSEQPLKVGFDSRTLMSTESRGDEYRQLSRDSDSEDDFGNAGCCSFAEEEDPEKEPDLSWIKTLTNSEKAKISLARAFIMNPEVLVLHRPLTSFAANVDKKILTTIQEHHSNRGLGLPLEDRDSRRPRSIFFTPETRDDCNIAQVVWQLGQGTVIEVEHHHISKDFTPQC